MQKSIIIKIDVSVFLLRRYIPDVHGRGAVGHKIRIIRKTNGITTSFDLRTPRPSNFLTAFFYSIRETKETQMKICKSVTLYNDGVHTKKYYFFGIRYLKCTWSNTMREIYLFKFKLFRQYKRNQYSTFINLPKKPLLLWFDHCLGGGTEAYTLKKFETLTNEYLVFRIQYFHMFKKFKIYSPNPGVDGEVWVDTVYELKMFFMQFKASKIVVNNLVGYKNSLDILNLITKIKTKNKSLHVTYMGHDFQSICPNYNLINCDGQYCNLKYKNGCEACWAKTRLGRDNFEHEILRSGATTISLWKKSFAHFFENTVDEMVVFSDAIKDIFVRAYPVLKTKIVVIPHNVRKYPRIKIPEHDGVNIACLGNICSYNKGALIIRQMCEYLKQSYMYTGVRLFVIGNLSDGNSNIPDNLHITGQYNPDDLPEIIKNNQIDIIFIPSVWPETFSYTTSEAMAMGLPVACFNLGAPAERVEKYKKGLVIKQIDAQSALNQMVDFIKR